MIVEFLKLTDDGLDQVVAAKLTIRADGTHEIEGDKEYVPLDLDVLLDGARVTFEADPLTWARHIETELRTPYLVAVVIDDK
ncbi:hypothetical protein ABH924_003349 [Arthrobacter sp. GAS37]|uniref:hypothetical protein n=1 Tax=Arthrobacter sp. GAS37 TaxID=3156261 RepID=UPI003837D98C